VRVGARRHTKRVQPRYETTQDMLGVGAALYYGDCNQLSELQRWVLCWREHFFTYRIYAGRSEVGDSAMFSDKDRARAFWRGEVAKVESQFMFTHTEEFKLPSGVDSLSRDELGAAVARAFAQSWRNRVLEAASVSEGEKAVWILISGLRRGSNHPGGEALLDLGRVQARAERFGGGLAVMAVGERAWDALPGSGQSWLWPSTFLLGDVVEKASSLRAAMILDMLVTHGRVTREAISADGFGELAEEILAAELALGRSAR